VNKRQKKAALAAIRRLMLKVIRSEAQEHAILRQIGAKMARNLKKGSKVTARGLAKLLSARKTKSTRATHSTQKSGKPRKPKKS